MKELSIEEKEEAYDMALETVQEILNSGSDSIKMSRLKLMLQPVFPELKENEDEKIRKWIINEIKIKHHNLDENNVDFVDKAIAWLENQSKQKPTDEVKRKFKVGDWIILYHNHRSIYQIEKIGNYQYFLKHILGGSITLHFSLENNIKLWTIKDVKDGDILVNGSNIFKFHFINGTRIMGYCHVNTDDGRFYDDTGKIECFGLIDDIVKPATKEQSDILFKAMSEAGYVFDFNKRELKKVISDVQSTKSKYTENDVITGEFLIKNGFEHRSGKFSDCYDIKFNDEAYIDLIQDKKSNTEWVLEILKHIDDDQSTCANRLVATISTIKELQDCLNKMNINLKIKY